MSEQQGFPTPLEEGCRYGRVRYQAAEAPRSIFARHCTDCQQLTSGAFKLGGIRPGLIHAG